MSALADVLRVVAALGVVCALAWAAIWVMRRMQTQAASGPGAGGDLKFVRALPLGPRERLVEVTWRGEALLLGVTAGGVSLVRREREGEPAFASAPRADPS